MKNTEQFEKIEKYLLNQLTEKEKQEFENELNSDDTLRKGFEQYKNLIQAIELEGMREKIQQFHKNTFGTKFKSFNRKTKNSINIPRAIPYLVAASVVIIVGVGIFRLFNPTMSHERLFSEFFKPDPGLITPMSARSDYLFYDGMIDYKLKDYKKAISRWEELQNTNTGSDTLNYFLGVAHLALKNDQSAVEYLEKALRTPANEFIHETRYYLGLAYLKQGKMEQAIPLFRESEIAESKLILQRLEEEVLRLDVNEQH